MQLTDEQLLRYSRQLLLPEVDIEGQIKLKQSKVLVAGMGGLGSPVSLYLAAAGVGHLVLVDFDRVDMTNLQRQILYATEFTTTLKVEAAKQRLLSINPDIQVEIISEPITEDNIQQLITNAVDVVMDCTDNFLTRDLLNRCCFTLKKTLISGAAIGLQGQLTTFDFRKETTPCYHCLFGDGVEQELTCSEAGVLGPVVGVIGVMQALEAIKIIIGFGQSLVGRLLMFDGLESRFKEFHVSADPHCKVCGK